MSRQSRIESTLRQGLALNAHDLLQVENESGQHSVPAGSETHFKVVCVSSQFSGKTRVQRHRLIQEMLKAEFQSGLHALSIQGYTPEEWARRGGEAHASPECAGRPKK